MTELSTIEVVVEHDVMKFLEEAALATGTTPDDVASVLVYMEFRKMLKEEGKHD